MKAALVMIAMTSPALSDEITVPSGQTVSFQDVIWNSPGPVGLAVRFRFVAPAIARETGSVDFAAASDDMLHLCQTYALPRIAKTGPLPGQIIISLSSAPVPFGEAAPDVTQFFEAYSVQEDTCIWEVF